MFTSWWVFCKIPMNEKLLFFVGCFLNQQSLKPPPSLYIVGPAQKHSSFTSRFIEVNDSKLGWLFFSDCYRVWSLPPIHKRHNLGVFWHIYVQSNWRNVGFLCFFRTHQTWQNEIFWVPFLNFRLQSHHFKALILLVVSTTHFEKYVRQNGNFPQFSGWK